jgi:glucose/arabinose dehydrogenase
MRPFRSAVILALLLIGCSAGDGAAMQSAARPFAMQEVGDFDEPWAIAFLADGSALVTEKRGGLKIWRPGAATIEVAGIPAVAYRGQGGMLDVAPAPDFPASHLVYLTYAEPGAGGNGLALARARLAIEGGSARLDDLQVIWRQLPKGEGGHYGAIIAFAPDGRHLFLSAGERQRFTPAQDPDQALGKILRLDLDGSVPRDNPMFAAGGVRAQTWSAGHRNPYGLAFAADGRLWENEMGPRGGDELNLIEPGRNYGWPIVSNGDNYDGSAIPDHPTRPEFQAPVLWWNPSISPAGLIIYSGNMFPQWRGSGLMGALSGEALVRVAIDGATARKADQWDMNMQIRDVAQAPDGSVFLLENGGGAGEGRLFRLTPAPQP